MAKAAERSTRDERFLWNRQANGNAFGQDQTPDGTAPAEFRRVRNAKRRAVGSRHRRQR